jgi:hypothetical protein
MGRFVLGALLACAHIQWISSARANVDLACSQIIERLDQNEFAVTRGIYSYFRIWGPGFLDSLNRLNREQVWVDMGAGQARAQLEYLLHSFDVADALLIKSDYGHLTWPEVSKRASAIAIAYKKPKISADKHPRLVQLYENVSKSPVARFEYKEGRLFEDIPLEELPKTKLITDYYGVMSYSQRPDLVLRRYFELLQTGGEIYLFGLQRTKVQQGEKEISFYEFIKSIEGVELKELERDENMNVVSVKLGLNNNAVKPSVPELELSFFEDAMPPLRTYKVK